MVKPSYPFLPLYIHYLSDQGTTKIHYRGSEARSALRAFGQLLRRKFKRVSGRGREG